MKRVMIISGESSGELYGALLVNELKARDPEIAIVGVGGDRMQSSGVELISTISSSFGIIEAIKTYGEIRKTFKNVVTALKSFNPQVIILINYPDFNIRVAKEAKRLGIKILYYASPQVWAWRRGRVKVIGRLIDKMAVILPFEEEIYRQANIPCEFVGHPILDEMRGVIKEYGIKTAKNEATNWKDMINNLKPTIKEDLGLTSDMPTMALMPGSRPHEIKKLMPVISNVISSIKRLYPDCQFVIPIAPNLNNNSLSIIHNELNKISNHLPLITQHAVKALLSSDIAVIASGTSTLQAAFLGVLPVVIYKLSPLTYCIGRLIVKTKHISLVNILLDYEKDGWCANKETETLIYGDAGLRIKELLQGDVNKENIVAELSRIIDVSSYRDEMRLQLEKIRKQFLGKEASLRVAEMVEELAESYK